MEKRNLIKKIFFISVFLIVLAIVLFIVVRYQVEGEKELPYEVEKILITSTVDGEIVEDTENLWNINLSQPNDVFIYINKKEDSAISISNIIIDNFVVNQEPQKGSLKILRPTGELKNLYQYSVQNYLNSRIEYMGDRIDDLKTLEVNSNGGVVGFRIETENISQYISNEETEVVYNGDLLNKAGVNIEEIKTNISFDLTIKTNNGILYKATITLDLPVGDISVEGTSSIEIFNLDKLVFKRI